LGQQRAAALIFNQRKSKMSPTSERKGPNWEAVEREYRAGQVSVRGIARTSAVTEGAIRRRAKAEGWTRALAERVREAGSNGTHGGTQPLRDADAPEPNTPQPAPPPAPVPADEAPPAGEDVFVTYLPGDGDPPTTQWRGVEFRAGETIRLTDPAHIEAAKTNRFFRVGKGDPKDQGRNPNDGFVWPT
jgi:hypothetical protein